MAHHINKSENISTFHAPKLAKSDNGSIDLLEVLMELNKNLSRRKPQTLTCDLASKM
jgi:hypothetical protein